MVAQIACIHAQGFGIICVSLHHIVAKAPCIARGTMLKPGSSPGFFRLVCTRIFLFLDTKKRPKLLKFGRFVYIFVYVLRKTLIFKVYCGERGTKTLNPSDVRKCQKPNTQGFSFLLWCFIVPHNAILSLLIRVHFRVRRFSLLIFVYTGLYKLLKRSIAFAFNSSTIAI